MKHINTCKDILLWHYMLNQDIRHELHTNMMPRLHVREVRHAGTAFRGQVQTTGITRMSPGTEISKTIWTQMEVGQTGCRYHINTYKNLYTCDKCPKRAKCGLLAAWYIGYSFEFWWVVWQLNVISIARNKTNWTTLAHCFT